jgi:hypothetical protein
MRSRLWLLAAVVAVLATVLGGIAFASSGSSRSPRAPGAWGRGYVGAGGSSVQAPAGTKETLRVITKTVHQKLVDADGSGSFNVGDYVVFNEAVYDLSHRQIGQDYVKCLFNFGAADCSGALAIDGQGTIVVHGLVMEQGASPIAVTGGTGHYATASGVAVVNSTQSTTRITLYLV